MKFRHLLLLAIIPLCHKSANAADATQFVWPDLAPGETSRAVGEAMPRRENENPPITRLINVHRPAMEIFLPKGKSNGTAVVILPGGGFGKVVPDLEGSEAAERLAQHGITVFVVNYRTNETKPKEEPNWKRPLQDGQRAVRLIRSQAVKWKIDPDKVGLLAFSAGGQVGAMLITSTTSTYQPIDDVDKLSFRPDFAMLVYPWQVLQQGSEELLPQIKISNRPRLEAVALACPVKRGGLVRKAPLGLVSDLC